MEQSWVPEENFWNYGWCSSQKFKQKSVKDISDIIFAT
jgi:hypothetical protein